MRCWDSFGVQLDSVNTGGARHSPASAAALPARIHNPRLTRSIVALMVAASLCVCAGAMSRPAHSQGVQLLKVDVAVVAKGYRVSKLIGTSVQNDKNETIGKIDDIIVDNSKTLFAILQVGGFLGLGSRLVAVSYSALKISDDGKKIELPGATKDQLKNLAEFKYPG